MNKTAYDLMPFLRDIETIKVSTSLSQDQKNTVLAEMRYSLPAPVFCKSCPGTLALISSMLGVDDGRSTKEPKKEIAKGRAKVPTKVNAKGKSLLLKSDEDRGGKGPSKAVVDKAKKERRTP